MGPVAACVCVCERGLVGVGDTLLGRGGLGVQDGVVGWRSVLLVSVVSTEDVSRGTRFHGS